MVWQSASATAKLKSTNISYPHIYVWRSLTEPPNFKSAIAFAIAIFGPTAEFNSHQYFRLYGNTIDLDIFLRYETLVQ